MEAGSLHHLGFSLPSLPPDRVGLESGRPPCDVVLLGDHRPEPRPPGIRVEPPGPVARSLGDEMSSATAQALPAPGTQAGKSSSPGLEGANQGSGILGSDLVGAKQGRSQLCSELMEGLMVELH